MHVRQFVMQKAFLALAAQHFGSFRGLLCKIIDFILELANIEDKKVSIDELYKEDEFDLEKEAKKAKKLSSKNNVKNDKKNKSNTKK